MFIVFYYTIYLFFSIFILSFFIDLSCKSAYAFILKEDKTPTSKGGEWQQINLGGSPISFQDKASGGLQRCADVLCHAKHDAHLAASTPRRT